MSYSPSLTYFLDRLQGFSTNIFRLETQNNDTATANKILRFSLPSNALLNMRSFALHFSATTAGTDAGARLPRKIDTLIERVEVTAGGVQLSQGLNYYNVLRHAKDALLGSKTSSVCGHPEIIRDEYYVDATGAITGTGNEVYASTNKQAQFTIDQWEGFIGTCEPKIIDAAILPDIVISIYLADNTVLTSSLGVGLDGAGSTDITDNGNGAATYELNNIHATIESIGLADAVYDNMVSAMIAQKGFLEIPFKQYVGFNNTHSGSTRFSVATQSLDRIWFAFRNTNYGTQAAPNTVVGHIVHGSTQGTINSGQFGTSKEKYIGPYYEFVEPTPSTGTKITYQLQLNGAYYPQFPMTAEEMYSIAKNSTLGQYQEHEMTLEQYKGHFFVGCARLNMPESEFSRTLSGLDTRSISLQGYLNTNNQDGNSNLVIFCEMTSTLRVGAGRMLEVVV